MHLHTGPEQERAGTRRNPNGSIRDTCVPIRRVLISEFMRLPLFVGTVKVTPLVVGEQTENRRGNQGCPRRDDQNATGPSRARLAVAWRSCRRSAGRARVLFMCSARETRKLNRYELLAVDVTPVIICAVRARKQAFAQRVVDATPRAALNRNELQRGERDAPLVRDECLSVGGT